MQENDDDSKTYSINKTKITNETPKKDNRRKQKAVKKIIEKQEEEATLSVEVNQKNQKKNVKEPKNTQKNNQNIQKNNRNMDQNKKEENPWMKPDNENEEIVKGKNNNKLSLEKLENSVKASNEKEKFNLISHATEEQKEYIKRAFANDDVEATFTDEKKKVDR